MMKTIEIHIEGYKIVISKEDEQVTKEEKDEKITMPSYPIYPTIPQNPDQFKYPYGTWTCGEMTVTNTETKCETPVRDRMVGKVSDENSR
jgi:hypothetical protein